MGNNERYHILELKDYLRVLRRSWIILTVSTLLGMALAGIAALVTTPTYTAKTQLFVAIQNSGSVTELQQGNTFTQARILSYVETAKTPVVLQPVIDSLALDMSPQALSRKIQTSADTSTVLISISATDESPVQSAALAQAVAESLIVAVQELEGTGPNGTSPVQLSVITPASAPTSPADPNTSLFLLGGTGIGIAAGLVIALLRSTLDTQIRRAEDLARHTDAPFLGGIAYTPDAAKKPLLTQTGQQSPRAESFRQIRTNLQFAKVNSKSSTVLVTSSLPGEGKSTTATNMALAMAQAGQRVVLVDADLRRPMIAEYLGLEGSAGLTTALVGAADLEHLLQPWGDDQLYVLTSGRIPPNPSELLGSDAMTRLLDELGVLFDAVIVDAPPLLPVTDATVLAQKVGGVVLVVGSAKVKTQDLEKSLASLRHVDANILGVVLNLLPTKGPDAYSYSYYSHAAQKSHASRKTLSGRKSFNGSHMNVAKNSRNISPVSQTATSEHG
ncbi:polysaccharide biosynthesis tyrosine autokinase [Arthrobacter gengyunqii]|uniref:Polysaccharide biosynthesis tyrosine autokinase n=1 Tax=Arthrobacter gengyunqii TaxID=2886940 RepID=A0ABS8GIX9_9MICC|nr:polysaccharide biosynthesis tyrosine autokinase [Arthrobacter gengyunqii]MCC3266575.1 polysaccharide biosynthesis tyrosine autokinase [Arthrobacter gengyunqii]